MLANAQTHEKRTRFCQLSRELRLVLLDYFIGVAQTCAWLVKNEVVMWHLV